MPEPRLERLLARVSAIDQALDALALLSSASLELLGVDGVGIVAMSSDAHRSPVLLSDDRAAALDRLQFGLGDGPCLRAFSSGEVVQAATLEDDDRWPTLSPLLVGAGISAVFAFPLAIDGNVTGTADFHRCTPGRLEPQQVADGMEIATVMASLVVNSSDGAVDGTLPIGWERFEPPRLIVHQAAGMVSVQAGVDVGEALAMMRARAWADGLTLDAVAEEVLSRQRRFEPLGSAKGKG